MDNPSEEVVDIESCEESSRIDNDSPDAHTLSNIWDDDKIEKVSNNVRVGYLLSYQYLTL